MSHRFDATLKDIVAEHPADFATAFGLPSIEPATALNVDLSTISAATDVALGFGEPICEIVDLNFQSGPDPRLPARLHVYNALLNLRYDIPVKTLLVLLRPSADAANLTGQLTYETGSEGIEFRYKIVRLWREQRETFLQGGVGLVPLAFLCGMADESSLVESLREVVHRIDARLQNEVEPAEAAKLMTATFVLAGLRVDEDELNQIFTGVATMPKLPAFDAAIEKGKIQQNQSLLLRLGRSRLGLPDAETEAELLAIKDLDHLERLTDAILTVESWQELLATP